MVNKKREIVIPGDFLGDIKSFKAGEGTFVEKGKIYSNTTGILTKKAGFINVTPLEGRYIPSKDDFVIGIVEDTMPTCWLVDIRGPYPALLHVSEVPWDVDFGETSRYLTEGDALTAKVASVDPEKKVDITLKDPKLRKLKGGQIIEVAPSKIPRLIGKKGSMISLIKKHTNCRFFIGQNGRIWINGSDEGIAKTIQTIKIIEKESITYGLTDKIKKFLEK